MRFLILFIALLGATAMAQTVDADRMARVLNGAEATLKVDSMLFEGLSDLERVRADGRSLERFRKTYGELYTAAREIASGHDELIVAVRQHQAKLRQCDQLLQWDAARSERERIGAVDACRNELTERRAMVDILIGEATERPASDPR